MAEWLILQLPRGSEGSCSWMLADAGGRPISAPQSGAIAQAQAQARGRNVGLIVASGDVLLTEVELPPKSGVRPQQLVAYALEEQLAADIETLHFAVGARDGASGRTAVAVVTRALMSRWLQELADAGITAAVICPDASLLPENPGHTVVMLDGDTLSLRRPGRPASAMPSDNIGAALEASLGEDMAAENLIFYVSAEDWQLRSSEVEALRKRSASLKVQLLNSGLLPLLAPQLVAGEYINLLSGEFAPQVAVGSGWRRWRLVAMLAVALFAVHVGGLSLEWLLQHRNERRLDADIGEIARNALPGDSGQGAVRSRVEQRLLAVQGESGNSGFMPALAALAQALGSSRGASLQALSYRDGGLDLKLKAGDAESLERIDQALRNDGWQAELTSGGAAGTGYEGRIQMRRAGASVRAR
ncbi:MAG TPA: type II secretion system protein GspL [Steroidobacteraceae bacterium]